MFQAIFRVAATAAIALTALTGCEINNPAPVAAAPAPTSVVVQPATPAPATVVTPAAGSVVVQPTY